MTPAPIDDSQRQKILRERDRECAQLELAGCAIRSLEMMNSKTAMTCVNMLKKQMRRHLIAIDKKAAQLGIPHPNPVTRPLR